MAVIINDFGMPSGCENCDLHNYHFCDITTTEIEKYYWEGGKPNDCPLRSADEMIKEIDEMRAWGDNFGNIYLPYDEVKEIIHKYCDEEQTNENS